MTITEFLEARIAEDEAAARAAIDPSGWGSSPDGRWRLKEVPYEGEWPRNPNADDAMWADSEWALHASIHDPARVLRECAAKRAIIDVAEHGYLSYLAPLAAVYSDHPDYREEWRW